MKLLKQRFEEMMNFWVPVVFGTFKLLVLGTGMFLAIKSHYDGEKKGQGESEAEGDESAVMATLLLWGRSDRRSASMSTRLGAETHRFIEACHAILRHHCQ